MGAFIDLTGTKAGSFSIVGRAPNSRSGGTQWNCVCECGSVTVVRGDSIRDGRSKSCGCVQRKKLTLDVLTAKKCREILDYNPDTGLFVWRGCKVKAAGRPAGTLDDRGYCQIQIVGRLYYAHRLAWLYMTGEWPADQVDHIDLDKSNNKFTNLRECDASKNSANTTARRNKSGLKGARWDKGKWSSAIIVQKKRIYLGRFERAEEAHAAYCAAAVKYHGEFARSS